MHLIWSRAKEQINLEFPAPRSILIKWSSWRSCKTHLLDTLPLGTKRECGKSGEKVK